MTLVYKQIKINYNAIGQGKTLVFLHGFLENTKMWDKIIPHFLDQYTCITIDLLGHGETDCIGYLHTMDDMANAVQSVLNHLGITEATCIGHSMGGYVTLSLIELFPEFVSGVVLLNSTAASDSEERKQNRGRAIDIVKKNPNAYTSMAIANLFAEENRSQYVTAIEMIKNQAARTPIQGIIAALEGMKVRKDHQKTLLDFKKPKILLVGRKDPVLPYQKSVEEASVCDMDIISFSGGHMSYLENYNELINALHKCLA